MHSTLLATKLHVPEHPQEIVARPRLVEALERALETSGHRLTVVSAPAGYGKTTLLANWARTTQAPVAWLALDSDDDEPDRFLRYLLAAWEQIEPEVAQGPLGILLGAQDPQREAVLAAFLNAAAGLASRQAIILDDYQVIGEAAIHASLAYLLDNLPPQLQFVIGARAEPEALPLARYRARGQLLELRAEDLRFSLDEAAEFLRRRSAAELASDDIQRWHEQVEGWAAGLQLAALSRRRPGGVPGMADVSGRQRYIADYLAHEVLALLPADVREFLLRTSLLEQLCAPLCEAVTGAPGGQAMLERLERDNLFVQALDGERRWFRYHPLFADFLKAELERSHAGEAVGLSRRAADWHFEHDLPEPAFRHALAGQYPDLAIKIFDRYFTSKLNGGELKTLRDWVEAIPPAWYADYPVLSLMQVGLLTYSGEFQASVRLIDDIEQQLAATESESARAQLARVMAVRCFMACFENDLPRAEQYAEQALSGLPAADPGFRPGIYGALGDTYRENGLWAQARDSYQKALELTQGPTMRLFAAHVYGGLADLALRQGQLRAAAGYWRQALAAIEDPANWGRLRLPVVGWVYIRTGELLYEHNQLAEAWAHVAKGLQHAELGGDVRSLIAGCVCAGRLKLTEGDLAAAGDYLERARPLVEKAHWPAWTDRFQRLQIEIWLAGEQLRSAMAWAEAALRNAAPEGETGLAAARVLIAKGDAPALERALRLLESTWAAAEAEGRANLEIEALALQALAHWARGDGSGALTALERALHRAEPEGYVRLLADLGLGMLRLLQEARTRHVMPEYVATLLSAYAGQPASAPDGPAGLPEPLTAREMDVLRLLAAGLTNREIAEKLVISAETVKKHSANIYGKLGASNRTQAVARARALALLD